MGKYKDIEKEEEKNLLIAKLQDKLKQCKTKNKIVNTEFLNLYEKNIILKKLQENKEKNYKFYGGYQEAESELLVLFPEKFSEEICNKNLENILKVISIKLPNELKESYSHRDYLGAVANMGIMRNRIGDIIVHKDGADIIIIAENAEYIKNGLQSIPKFRKSKIEILPIDKLKTEEKKYENIDILVASMRLDNIVSEITKFSRSKTEEWINAEKVFVNDVCEDKNSKIIKEGDVLSIRTSGKYIVDSIIGNNKKGKIKISIKKRI